MRAMRTFRGFISQDSKDNKEELRDFCKEHLAYLIDDKLRVVIRKLDYKSINDFYEIRLVFNNNVDWVDIKYDFIPFFITFVKKYKVIKNSFFYNKIRMREELFRNIDIEEDEIPDDFNIHIIKLEVEFKRERR
jgi:hypothetical protein